MYSEICEEEEEEDTAINDHRSSAGEISASAQHKLTLRWRRHAELEKEVANMSEEKARKLFTTETARQSWIDEIRTSVERNIQSQVRAVLGTPPIEKRKKLYEERKAAERRKWQLEKDKANTEGKSERKNYSCAYDEEGDEIMLFRRQHCLQKFNSRRTMRAATLQQTDFTTRATSGSPVCLDPLTDGFNKNFSPYTRVALENVDKARVNSRDHVFKRAAGAVWFDHSGTRHELPGPYWPKDHLPVYPNQSHIHYIPRDVEPLNTPVSNQCTSVQQEASLYPRQWRGHQVVYDRQLRGQPSQRCISGSPPGLVFESRFECGNLRQAKRIGNYEYDLILNTDLYTKRHTQWYYFCVRGMIPGVTYKFNIINLLKKDSLYNYGMKPLLYSEIDASQEGLGWIRAGHHIDYHKNLSYRSNLLQRNLEYHTLTFQMEFPHDADTCYLAHCYPYSYTDLELYLRTMVDQPHTSQHVRKEVLCQTVAGNSCHVLTITSSKVPDSEKLGVVLSARVHPGETNASWMMKGMLDFLTSGHPVAEKLRRKFVFKVVPMLNPDGVIVGNYRTNLAARDLNRTYREPNKENFPTVWHTKNMLEMFKNDHEVIIYCDLHGHSRKPNVFMYGCTNDSKVNSMSSFVEERLFPWMMSQKAPDKFSFSGCKFRVRKCKESTARVVMWRQMGITNSFTMEATFCGANFGEIEKGRHFNVGDFEAMGRHFCEVLLDYSEAKSGNRSELTQAFVELACKMTRDILKQTLGNFHLEKLIEKAQNIHSDVVMTKGETTADGELEETGASGVNRGDLEAITSSVGDESRKMEDLSSPNCSAVLKSARMESFNDCMKILEGLNLADQYEESDSSDSDSDMENDDSGTEKDKGDTEAKETEKRKKKKKKKKAKHWWDTLSKPVASQEPSKPDDTAKQELKKVKTNVNKFVNPYNNRSNGGIPIFSQERILERARKKENQKNDEKKDFLVKFSDGFDEDSAPLFSSTDDASLNYITAQRRLAYYMLTKNTSNSTMMRVPPFQYQPVVRQLVEVDSFKFDYLSGGDHGFSVRVPYQHQRNVWLEEKKVDHKSREPRGLQTFEEARREQGQRRKISPAYAVDLEDNSSGETRSYQPNDFVLSDLKTRGHERFSRHISNLKKTRGQADERGSLVDLDNAQVTRNSHSSRARPRVHERRDRYSYDSTEDAKKSHSAGATTRIPDGPEFIPSVLPSYYSRIS